MKTVTCTCGETLQYQELYNGVQVTQQFATDRCPNCRQKPNFNYLMKVREHKILFGEIH